MDNKKLKPVQSAVFLQSNTDYKNCPKPHLPEYAFIGRSNVGKSSLINKIANNNKLAHTSAKPGKTQVINHYLIDEKWYLVDLPGYGYASVSKSKKADFSEMIEQYALNRPNLMCFFVLVDSRLPPQAIDISFIEWLGFNQVPFVIAFTKADKQGQASTQKNISLFKNEMLKTWENLPQMFVTSAQTGFGCTDVLQFIRETNLNFAKH